MSFLHSLLYHIGLHTPNVSFLRNCWNIIQFNSKQKRAKLMSLIHLSCFIVSKNSCNLRVFRMNIFRPYNFFLTNFISVCAKEPRSLSLSCRTTRNGYMLFVHFPGDRNDTAGNLQEFQAIWKSSTQKKCENDANHNQTPSPLTRSGYIK